MRLLQSHSSSSSTWQHHSLVPHPDACQTLNELVQRDTQTENKSHFCILSLQTDGFIQFSHCCSLQLIVKAWLKQMRGWKRRSKQDCNDLVLFQFKLLWECTLRHKGLSPAVIYLLLLCLGQRDYMNCPIQAMCGQPQRCCHACTLSRLERRCWPPKECFHTVFSLAFLIFH